MILQIGDSFVDLYPNAEIFYTVQRVDIGSLANRKVSFTNQFNAPWTENNELLFGFAKHEESPNPIIYTLRSCKISNDGIEFSPSMVLYITKSDDDKFALQIFESIFDFFQTVSERRISDFNAIENSPWNPSDIDDARDNTGGIISALIDWGVPIYFSDLFMPSFFYHTIVKAILQDTGFSVSGAILTDTDFTDLVIPYGLDKFEYPETYFRQFNFKSTRSGDQPVVNSIDSETGVFSHTIGVETTHGTYFVRVSVGGITWGTGNNLLLRMYKNGDLVASKVIASNPAPGGSVEMEYETYVDDTDSYNWEIYSDAMSGPGISYTIVDGAGASSYLLFTADGVVNRNMVNWNVLLPLITAKDLLQDFFTRFAIIPDLVDNTIVLKTMEEIISDIPNSKNWAPKYVNPRKKTISFKTSYAQINEFSYVNKADSPDLGTGSLDIVNTTLPAKKTIYKSLFSNSNTIQYFSWNVARIPVFNGLEEDNPDFGEGRQISGADSLVQNDEGTIVVVRGTFNLTVDILDPNTEIMIRNDGVGTVTLIEGAGVTLPNDTFAIEAGYYAILVWRNDEIPDIHYYPIIEFASFYQAPGIRLLTIKARTIEDSITFDSTPRTDYFLAYFIDETLTKDTGWQYFIDQYYNSLREALQKNKVIGKEYMLEEQDVYEYSPHFMVYDGDGYYIVNKLNNFKPGKVTKAELFKVF